MENRDIEKIRLCTWQNHDVVCCIWVVCWFGETKIIILNQPKLLWCWRFREETSRIASWNMRVSKIWPRSKAQNDRKLTAVLGIPGASRWGKALHPPVESWPSTICLHRRLQESIIKYKGFYMFSMNELHAHIYIYIYTHILTTHQIIRWCFTVSTVFPNAPPFLQLLAPCSSRASAAPHPISPDPNFHGSWPAPNCRLECHSSGPVPMELELGFNHL